MKKRKFFPRHDAIFLDWIPLHSVGPFKFGDNISNYTSRYNLPILEDEFVEAVGWIVYQLNGEERIYVENGEVDNIGVEKSLWYCGYNLIGMHIDKVKRLLDTRNYRVGKNSYDWLEKKEKIHFFYSFGAMFWVRRKRIVTAVLGLGPLLED
jgi:hypothetical protein